MEMRVVIVGAGNIGRELAARLGARHQVLLLDTRAGHLELYGQPLEPGQGVTDLAGGRGVRYVRGDGTSRLVLSALFDPDLRCGLVAVTATDEANHEAGRLARAIGYDPVIAVQYDRRHAERYREERITALDRSQLLADHVERSLHHKGAVIPGGVGFGRGELVEISLQRSSPVLGRPLKQMQLQRWRVAAVFRGDRLIVPTGDTVLEVDDRVLLVGDPDVMASVTDYLRLGTPQFPRPYGPNIVTLELSGPDPGLVAEGEWLATSCAAASVVCGAPGAEDRPPDAAEEAPLAEPDAPEPRHCSFPLPGEGEPMSVKVGEQRPGTVVVRPVQRRWYQRLLGLRGPDAELCDALGAPVLFARGSHPYRRLLLPVSYSPLNVASAEVAIDITRRLGTALTAINVDLPAYISGTPIDALHEEVVPIRRLAELYEVPLEYRHREGNPIELIVGEARDDDLIVVVRRRGRRDTYPDPDVALRIARRAPCSVLVVTAGREP